MSNLRFRRRFTFRKFAAFLFIAVVVAATVSLDDRSLLAGTMQEPMGQPPAGSAVKSAPLAGPALIVVPGWAPNAREVLALLAAALLGTITIAGRIRYRPRGDRNTPGTEWRSAAPSRSHLRIVRRAQPTRVLELRSVRGTGGGPEKTILLGARDEPGSDVQVTVCYVRDRRDNIFNIDQRAASLWIDYVELRERHSFDPRIWSALARLIRDRRIDIVHAHDYKTNLLALIAGRLGLATPLSTVHGWNGTTLRESALYYPTDKRLLARFPHLIAVSSQIRDELVRHGAKPERVSVIHNGIEPQIFRRRPSDEVQIRRRLDIGPDRVVIGSIGRLAPEKGFGGLLQAFARLRCRRSNLLLLIVGDGPERDRLQHLARELGLGDDCRFLGQQANVIEIHHALDLFVQSSLTEGTPNVVLEAMAMETPIVATSAGGTGELVRPGTDALVIPPGDRQALEHAIEAAIDDRVRAAARAAAARVRVETELSFAARRRAVEAIYHRLRTACDRQTSRMPELALPRSA